MSTPHTIPTGGGVKMPDRKIVHLNRAALRSLSDAIGQFRDLSVTMPVGEVHMFLIVALNEGMSLTELSAEADMKKSTASRYLLDLSDKTRSGGKGYGLIKRDIDPQELRKNMYSLTPKGRRMVEALMGQKKAN